MGLLAFVDTETNKGFDKKKRGSKEKVGFDLPADHPSQPKMVSGAYILCDEASLEIYGSFYSLVKPEGDDFAIDAEAYSKHRIDVDMMNRFGLPSMSVAAAFADLLELGRTEQLTLVAHSLSFDHKILRGLLRRHGMSDYYQSTMTFCTMMSNIKEVAVPMHDHAPKGPFRWPSLKDTYRHYTGKAEVPGAHTALNDALACKFIYKLMRDKGKDLTPRRPKEGGKPELPPEEPNTAAVSPTHAAAAQPENPPPRPAAEGAASPAAPSPASPQADIEDVL